MLSYALAIARGQAFSFSQADIPYIRRRFAAEIALCDRKVAASKL